MPKAWTLRRQGEADLKTENGKARFDADQII
jgi:hypothetical protein